MQFSRVVFVLFCEGGSPSLRFAGSSWPLVKPVETESPREPTTNPDSNDRF